MREGFHRVEANHVTYLVPERYQNLIPIGYGVSGLVCCAEDVMKNNLKVAVKKLYRPFLCDVFAKHTYRELKFLRHMKHENVIDTVDLFTPDSDKETFEQVYFVSTLNGTSLRNILRRQRLQNDQIQLVVYQILSGLKYIHSAGIIHRDIKPENIAVDEYLNLKILDFGLARQQTDEGMTGYVVTRPYRAPEIMLNWMHYNQKVDIWSVGCVMAELITGTILFPDNTANEMNSIVAVVGAPSEEFLTKLSRTARNYFKALDKPEKIALHNISNGATLDSVDFLEKLLQWDPDYRLSAVQALEHAYLNTLHDPDDEPVADFIDMSFESLTLTVDEWREMVWNEIEDFQRTIKVDLKGVE